MSDTFPKPWTIFILGCAAGTTTAVIAASYASSIKDTPTQAQTDSTQRQATVNYLDKLAKENKIDYTVTVTPDSVNLSNGQFQRRDQVDTTYHVKKSALQKKPTI